MSTGNNIKKYTAADIEKYHRGLLSSKERNDLEKAALEDPFLADAIEGYTTEGVHIKEDLADLKKRLHEKVKGTKVIPLNNKRSQQIPVLRIAAILILLVGAGLLVYKFSFNRKEQEIAKVKSTPKNNELLNDTAKNKATGNQLTPINSTSETAGIASKDTDKLKESSKISDKGNSELFSNNTEKDNSSKANNSTSKPSPEIATPVALEKNKQEVLSGNEIAKDESADVVADEKKEKQVNAVTTIGKPANASRKMEGKTTNRKYNIFRGRITDTENRGVPFANVMNIDDQVATYTDANGYFNLTNPDSVLKVQVRSIGFLNDTVTLNHTVISNKIVMAEDKKSISPYVINKGQSISIMKKRDANQVFEEPEPADGWINYGAYMANNLKIPGDFEMKSSPNSSVEVSFEVNNLGEPINIRIEKSLCATCDKEAIRLIKEGPKWKRTERKTGRTSVFINF